MADRRYDWDRDRNRDYMDRDREYGRGPDRDRGTQDRGMMSRGADEVRSWFGDDEAQRRREMDETRDRQQERGWGRSAERDRFSERERYYGPNSEYARGAHGWSGGASRQTEPRWSEWQRSDRQGEQQWSGSAASAFDSDYSLGAPNWSGAPSQQTRGYSSGELGRSQFDQDRPRYGHGYSGDRGYRAGQSSSSLTGEGRWGYSAGGQDYNRPDFRGGYSSGFGDSAGRSRYGGTFAGRGPRSYQRSDDRIREDVNECLTADPRIDASEIEVRVERGEVILSGTVEERRLRRLAEEIIEDLPGVRDVRNDLRVSQTQWTSGGQGDRTDSRDREDGALGKTGDPQKRDEVTTLNSSTSGKINR